MGRWFASSRLWLAVVVVAGLAAVAFWPQAVTVDVAAVVRGPLTVTIDEEGETRVRHRFVVSAPVAGRVLRIDLEPGDAVVKGRTVVARMLADPPSLLDARARAEAEAAVRAAEGALGRARADSARATSAAAFAAGELEREQELFRAGVSTQQNVQARDMEARTTAEARQAAEFSVAAAAAQLEQARARLTPPAASPGRIVPVAAPISGVVLRRLRESESVVPAGEPLVELGDPGGLEIVSDLLSVDAVRVRPGMRVLIEEWGGDRQLTARVRLVEPAGFTKVSALGVEEQRVNVLMDFDGDAESWSGLGDAYRVEVRIVTWESPSALLVPTGALFRAGEDWAVYVVDANGRARRTPVRLGQRTAESAEVLDGLTEGQTVILHPSDRLQDDMRVTIRDRT